MGTHIHAETIRRGGTAPGVSRRPFGGAVILILALAVAALTALPCLALAQPSGIAIENPAFAVEIDGEDGTVVSLERAGADHDLQFVSPPGRQPQHLGDVRLRYRRTDLPHKAPQTWTAFESLGSDVPRTVRRDRDGSGVSVSYSTEPESADSGLDVRQDIRLDGDAMIWTLTVSNPQYGAVELGDLGLPLPFNDRFRREHDPTVTYTQYVLRHGAVALDNSFFYWVRADGMGPRLVMTPGPGTHLEYIDEDIEGQSGVAVYIHALAEASDMEPRGTWRLPLSAAILAPRGEPGDSVSYSFAFHWARDDQAIRQRLTAQGLLDIEVAPGLTIPRDLPGLVSIGGAALDAVEPEHPERTEVERLTSPVDGRTLLRFRFDALGENAITLRWDGGKETRIEYFVTEPLEVLIKKRADFLIGNQQVRDSSKWYDGMFSLWDMEQEVLRTPDDLAGLHDYMVGGGDDPDLSKAPFLAAKNAAYPDPDQIAAIEYYLSRFVWGKLQRTDEEDPYPFGIYGVPNWKQLRESERGFGSGGYGEERLWRSYDYPHLVQLYFTMYEIARDHPEMVGYLDAEGYLDRALGTARAFFAVPYDIDMDPAFGFPGYNDWSYKLGIFHEHYIAQVIDALEREGRGDDAAGLRDEWLKKVTYFAYDRRYPFGSEMNFDTTAFQSAHALARYGLTHEIAPGAGEWRDKNSGQVYTHPSIDRADFRDAMDRALTANLAARGTQVATFYQLGSDYRGSLRYLLSYMSQMGGLEILDYGLHYADHPSRYLRLGYASALSSWALMNSGTPDSEYGYWYPGRANDGAAGWGFTARKYGTSVFATHIRQGRGAFRYDGEIDNGYSEAVAAARTVISDDPIFGLIALGGELDADETGYAVRPRDGVRRRLSVRDGAALDIALDQDGFAAAAPVRIARDRSAIRFLIEARTASPHRTGVTVTGLPAGRYAVDGETRDVETGAPLRIEVPVEGAARPVSIERLSAG